MNVKQVVASNLFFRKPLSWYEPLLLLDDALGRRYAGSSGTNLVACLELAAAIKRRGERGSIVSLLCDRGERYAETLFDEEWRRTRGLEIEPWLDALRRCTSSGEPDRVPTQRPLPPPVSRDEVKP